MSGIPHTPDLFPGSKPARQRPRWRMHFLDVGYIDGIGDAAVFGCDRCGHETGWMAATDAEIRRGVPCPRCNGDSPELSVFDTRGCEGEGG